MTGVVWAHVSSAAVADFTEALPNHYLSHTWAQAAGSLTLPSSQFQAIAGFASLAGYWDTAAFVGVLGPTPGCDTPPFCDVALAIPGGTISRSPALDALGLTPAGIDVLGHGETLVTVSEPDALLQDAQVRYVALAPDISVTRVVFELGGRLTTQIKGFAFDPPAPGDAINVLSAYRNRLWRIQNGSPLVVWTYPLQTGAWEVTSASNDLGRVLAAVYSRFANAIIAVDEVSVRDRHRVTRHRRLVALTPETGHIIVLADVEPRAENDRVSLAIDPNGGIYLASSSRDEDEHTVVFLAADHGRLDVQSVWHGRGQIVPGLARADAHQVGIVVMDRTHGQRVVAYERQAHHSGAHGEHDDRRDCDDRHESEGEGSGSRADLDAAL